MFGTMQAAGGRRQAAGGRRQAAGGSRSVAAVIAAEGLAAQSRAQGSGDANGDGRFDGNDFPLLVACLRGPLDGPADPGCSGADADNDGVFTLRDLARIIRGCPSRPTLDCDNSPINGLRRYAGYRVTDSPLGGFAGIEGAGATMTVMDTPLCADNATYGPFAFSASWVGIVQSERLPYAQAQLGFLTGRAFPIAEAGAPPAPNPARFHKLYVEIIWDNIGNHADPSDPQYYLRWWTNSAPVPTTMQFDVWHEPGILVGGGIFFQVYVDAFPESPLLFQTFHASFPNHGFRWSPDACTFTSETANTGDHVAGTVFRPCTFFDCLLYDANFDPVPVNFGWVVPRVEQEFDHDPDSVGIRTLNFTPNNAFEIWDRRDRR